MINNGRQIEESFWKYRRVFVTGATGFVGAWLIKELLLNEAYIVALVRDADPQSEFYRSGDFRRVFVVNGRLEDFGSLERAINEHEVDTVFHLAAQSLVCVAHRFPLRTFESNIRGSYNLLEACRVHSGLVKRVVVASSDKAYGTQPVLPYTEDIPLQGRYPYDVSKSCTDLLAHSYYYSYGLPIGIARCGNIYGGADLNWSRIVPGTIRSLLRNERPLIRSDGQYVRDYIYIKDVTRAYMHLAESLSDSIVQGQAFNFSLEQPLTVSKLVNTIQRLMGCEHLEPDIRNTARGEIYSQYLSAEKTWRTLKWRCQFTLEQGLLETIEWYRKFMER